jgi:tetratricopeptide (TPR) repeat protein
LELASLSLAAISCMSLLAFDPVKRLFHAVRRNPARVAFASVLLLFTAAGLYLGGRHIWAEYHYRAARRALEQRAFAQAHDHLERALLVWPRYPELHLLRARLARQSGLYGEAERSLERCKRFGAAGEPVQIEAALLRAQQGDFTQGLEVYLRGLVKEGHPDTLFILEALSRGYMQNYRLEQALDCLDLWLNLRPDDLQALLGRGWVLERMFQFEKARESYERATAVAPDSAEAELRLGQILMVIGLPIEALPIFERSCGRQPNSPAAGLGLAQCYVRLGRNEEAQQLLDQLIAGHPREGSLLLERGNLALSLGQVTEAESFLRQAVQLLPHDYQANYSLSQCLRQLDKEAEAQVFQKRAERLQADLVLMQDLTDKLQEHPYDPSLRCQVGQIFLRNGEHREGRLWLESALRADPMHRPAHRALADYYEAKGDVARAEHHRRLAQ